MTPLDCEACGAEAGQECKPDCVGVPARWGTGTAEIQRGQQIPSSRVVSE